MATAKPVSRRHRVRAAQRNQALIQYVLIAGIGLLLLGLLFYLPASSSGLPQGRARVGYPMPDFSLKDLQGQTVHFKDYAGQVILVNGWATWCPPCRAEMPDLQSFYAAHQAEGFQLLAINAGESQGQAASFIQQMGFTFPVLLDPGEAALVALGENGLPSSFVVGRDGQVKYIHVGVYALADLNAQVAPLLSQ